jgi:3'(2'), 5'-bisphosphate nucleotidase
VSRHEIGALAGPVCALAVEAGQRILEVYHTGFSIERKADRSPVTAADRLSHEVIALGLEALTPGVPVWSEESAQIDLSERSRWRDFWLVDPLDGTREFIKRNGEFTVNIALVRDHRPVLGVIHLPVKHEQFYGGEGLGSFASHGHSTATCIEVCRKTEEPIRIAGSRSHDGDALAAFLSSLPNHRLLAVGSSIKFCMVASGKADVYPRLGPTSEWDTAAGQAIVEGAGGNVTDLAGDRLQYNLRTKPINPYFVAFGDASRNWPAFVHSILGAQTGREP